MKLLLDTHLFIWWVSDDRRLKEVAREMIASADNEVFVSAVSAWEIEIKRLSGKLRFDSDVAEAVASQGFLQLPIEFRHTAATSLLPAIHHDPFDRLLVSQARTDSLWLLTVDEQVLKYPIHLVDCS